jgi:hypothetical protein
MKPIPNLIGKRFGRLVVIDKAERRNNYIYWLCKCDCGVFKEIQSDNVRRNTRSCGCLKHDSPKYAESKKLKPYESRY